MITERPGTQAGRTSRTAVVAVGKGTNVQDRAVALHHLDAPWRPADVAQREGRILRQGNLNAEVQVLRYVTERSFDGYMWQAVERKARFIAQVMRGRLDVREIEDIGDAALSYNEVKALATGNPLLMEKAEADAELTRLQRAERSYHRNQDALRYKITASEGRIQTQTALAEDIDAAIARRRDTRGDAFTMTVNGCRYDKRHDAGQRLRQLLERDMTALADSGQQRVENLAGHLGGFDLSTTARRVLGVMEITLTLDCAAEAEIRLSAAELAAADPARLVIRLENRLTGQDALKVRTLDEIDRLRAELARAREDVGKPFPQSGQLAAACARAAEITKQLEEAAVSRKRDEHPTLAELAGRTLEGACGAPGYEHEHTATTGRANGASSSKVASAVTGVPPKRLAGTAEVSGGLVPTRISDPWTREAVRISQQGFPEPDPLTGPLQPGRVARARTGAYPERRARPTR